MAFVKEITSAVFDEHGNEAMPPGTRVPWDAELPPDVRWRPVEVPDPEPAPAPAAEVPPKAAPARHATVKAEAAEGKGTAHK
jgi:hypothetical protein